MIEEDRIIIRFPEISCQEDQEILHETWKYFCTYPICQYTTLHFHQQRDKCPACIDCICECRKCVPFKW